jgi:transcriptional regulator GlxA family with amidase domain
LPPCTYLSQLRITRARRLLEQGMSVVSVAQATGFVDQSHLHRVFRRLVGVTPGVYASAMAHRRPTGTLDHPLGEWPMV